ncbi:hypothetical protein FNV43_RR03476 [Rhamnella rubrinervis]|uniref:Uncharacterized protein n=1 Tax=Rhamnella rubrinervis TaxID=2594499 RepID=A0A8K0HK21_9ROSA|nr:hypothetical protein FNV43_RR03476 [Rhamnella rubrinervis]
MKVQKRTKRTYVAWIVALVFALIVYHPIASIGFFKFVVMFTMMLSDWKTSKSLLTALMFSAKVVFIKKRPQNRQFKGSGNYCTSCDRSLQEPYIHCSLGCKVDYVLKQKRDLSPYLRTCNSLQLSPDFFVPQDMGDDEMTNETPHSTIVDSDEHMSSSWGSSGSENMSMACTEIVRKKRSGLYVCARSTANNYKVSHHDEDMATSMSRRKGIPHRSPLC